MKQITDKRTTVKLKIFASNTWMVVIVLLLFLAVNSCIVKLYAETVEDKFMTSLEGVVEEEDLKHFVKEWTVEKESFVLLFLLDGVACIGVLVGVSQLFTKSLTRDIMKPLEALEQGAYRVQNNELEEAVSYQGMTEFENVCVAFNEMQAHILAEQEKNCKYEKARTDMIAGISHDLRTPLTAIRGSIKGILDGVVTKPEQQTKFLTTAYRRTNDMDMLLGQLFYLSKLETGNMPVALQTIDVGKFITEYVSGKNSVLTDADIQLTADVQQDTILTAVDMEQMQRILDNLIENSRKYANVRPLQMTIRVSREADVCKIWFTDNGQGVAEDKIPYLFDEFYRADESRSNKDGNGLGLYIVKHLMEMMHGTACAMNTADGFVIGLELPVVTE